MRDVKSLSVINNTPGYFEQKTQEYDSLLDAVKVPEAFKKAAMADAIVSSAKEGTIGSIPFAGGQ